MTLENMKQLLEMNNREILDRIQDLKITLDVLMETGVSNGSGSVDSKELEELKKQIKEIQDTIDSIPSYTEEDLQTAILDIVNQINTENGETDNES